MLTLAQLVKKNLQGCKMSSILTKYGVAWESEVNEVKEFFFLFFVFIQVIHVIHNLGIVKPVFRYVSLTLRTSTSFALEQLKY